MTRIFKGVTAAVLLIAVAVFSLPETLSGSDDLNLPATAKTFVLPQYNKGGELQYIVYGAEAKSHGALIDLSDVVIDLVKEELWEQVKIDHNMYAKYYLQNIKSPETFWPKEKPCSKGLLFSETAEMNREKEKVHSNSKVAFRSQYLDADGIGFDADLDEQHVHIRSHVVVTIRTAAYASRNENSGKE